VRRRAVALLHRCSSHGAERSARRRVRPALGQAVRNQQPHRLSRRQSARERRVIRAVAGITRPAPPRATGQAHRARRTPIPVRVRVRIGKTPQRRVTPCRRRQLDAEGGVDSAHIAKRQRAAQLAAPRTSVWTAPPCRCARSRRAARHLASLRWFRTRLMARAHTPRRDLTAGCR